MTSVTFRTRELERPTPIEAVARKETDLFLACWGGTVEQWRVDGAKFLEYPTYKVDGDDATAVAATAESVFTGSSSGRVEYWNRKKSIQCGNYTNEGWITDILFYGGRMISSAVGGKVKLCPTNGRESSSIVFPEDRYPTALAIDGDQLAIGNSIGQVAVYDLRNPSTPLHTTKTPDLRHDDILLVAPEFHNAIQMEPVTALASYKGTFMAATESGYVHTVVPPGEEARIYTQDQPIESLSVSEFDAGVMCCGHTDGTVRLWDLEIESHILLPGRHTDSVRAAFAWNDSTTCTASYDGTLKLTQVIYD